MDTYNPKREVEKPTPKVVTRQVLANRALNLSHLLATYCESLEMALGKTPLLVALRSAEDVLRDCANAINEDWRQR